jgi:branched-chain amino acid transport system substrate-binding protein
MKQTILRSGLVALAGPAVAQAQAPIPVGHIADYSGPTSDVACPMGAACRMRWPG